MSFTEYFNEKKQESLNHKQHTEKAIEILKQCAAWLHGSAEEKPECDDNDVKQILAKALDKIGTLNSEPPAEPEENTEPEETTNETPVEA